MSDGWTPREFEVVRRGYAPAQVDDTFAELVQDLLSLRAERDNLLEASAGLNARVEQLSADAPTYRGLGDRVERILQLAEEEAAELRRSTAADVESQREQAQQAVLALQTDADAYAEGVRKTADADAQGSLEQARRETAAVREQAEKDQAQRREAAEARVLEAERRASVLRDDCDALLADSQRRAEQIVAEAEGQGRQIVRAAEVEADRRCVETDRELTALTLRRDDINRQLTNVRQVLASLIGSAEAAAQERDDTAKVEASPPAAPAPAGTAASTAAEAAPSAPTAAGPASGRPESAPAATTADATRTESVGSSAAPPERDGRSDAGGAPAESKKPDESKKKPARGGSADATQVLPTATSAGQSPRR